jgi:hypothetical protein
MKRTNTFQEVVAILHQHIAGAAGAPRPSQNASWRSGGFLRRKQERADSRAGGLCCA